MSHLDTHVAIWLYHSRLSRLSAGARRRIDLDELAISGMAMLEAQLLFEIGRFRYTSADLLDTLRTHWGVALAGGGVSEVMAAAVKQSWTRDPFDRVIVGHATVASEPLITADDTILENYPHAIW